MHNPLSTLFYPLMHYAFSCPLHFLHIFFQMVEGWSSAFWIISVITIVSNLLFIVAFLKSHQRGRMRTSLLLINLAAADLLVGAVATPMYTLFLVPSAALAESVAFRHAYDFADVLLSFASLFGLTLIGLERAYAVFRPHKHRTLKRTTYIVALMVCWALASVQAVLRLPLRMEASTIVYFFYSSFTWLLLVTIVITASYLAVWMKMKAKNASRLNGVRSQRERKLTKTLIIVTAAYLISWLPFIALNALWFFCRTHCLPSAHIAHLIYSTKLLHYGNSFVNPIIYSFRLPRVRFTLVKMFCRRPNAIGSQDDHAWMQRSNRKEGILLRRGSRLCSSLTYYNVTTAKDEHVVVSDQRRSLVNGHCT